MKKLNSMFCITSLMALALVATSASANIQDPLSMAYEEVFVDADTGKSIKLRGTKASIDAFVAAGKYKKHTNPRAWQNMQDSAELNAALHSLKDGEQLHPVKMADGTVRYVKTAAPDSEQLHPVTMGDGTVRHVRTSAPNVERSSAQGNTASQAPRPRGTHRMDRVGLGPGDWADGVTTAIGLAQEGVKEANPLLSGFGDGASVAALGLKYGIKRVAVASGTRPSVVNFNVESMGWLAACANIATVTGAAAPPALAVGGLCLMVARNMMRTNYEAATGMTIQGRWLTDAEWDAAIAKKNR